MGNFLKRNGSTILTCIGVIGVVATAVMTAKATPKALSMMDEAEWNKGDELTKVETVKAAAPAYIPAIMVGAVTITSILAADGLNRQSKAAIISAYSLLYTSYNKYKNKIKELYGEEVDERVTSEMAKDQYDDFEDILEEEECLFYDLASQQYFASAMRDVIQKVTMDDGMECYIITTPFDLPASYYVNL